MGTNYYWRSKPCLTCGHSKEELHIGKSSCGWCFSLQVFPDDEDKPQNLADWERLFEKEKGEIFDEYDTRISVKDLFSIITKRSSSRLLEKSEVNICGYKTIEKFLERNCALLGPNNLLRSTLDGDHCVGHGKGTWDLIASDFS